MSSTARIFSSAFRTEEAASSSSTTALAVAGAAAALGSGMAAWTLCEQQHHHPVKEDEDQKSGFQRLVTKQGLADPMTAYQKHALHVQKKEIEEATQTTQEGEEEQDQQGTPHEQQGNSSPSTSVQATSPENKSSDVPVKPNIQTFPTEMTESEARLEKEARKAKQHSGGIKIFSGNGNMSLALEIVRHLGISLGKATVGRFADGEVNVVINENVRGKDVYVVQPTGPPVNDNIMELLLMVSTLRRASARRITVVIPYYGYARQDRKMQVRSMQSSMFHLE